MCLGLGRPNTDLILVNKAGRPVRREGAKWEPDRLSTDTLFILGSRANKVKSYDLDFFLTEIHIDIGLKV